MRKHKKYMIKKCPIQIVEDPSLNAMWVTLLKSINFENKRYENIMFFDTTCSLAIFDKNWLEELFSGRLKIAMKNSDIIRNPTFEEWKRIKEILSQTHYIINLKTLKLELKKKHLSLLVIMTREEKELLLRDLCARLPYGVKCTTKSIWNGIYTIVGYKDNRVFLDCPIYEEGDDEWMIESIVPYFRPMSSMTKEECVEFKWLNVKCDAMPTFEYVPVENYRIFDWLNRHHFDYRGLIEKGLALEAPFDMYK